MRDCILQRFRLAALIKCGLQQGDRQCGQLTVGVRLHVIGNNRHLKALIRIVLLKESLYRIKYDRILMVSGKEYKEIISFGSGRLFLTEATVRQERGEREEEDIKC